MRDWIPILGILTLAALFLKLPEVPDFLGVFTCKKCIAGNPYHTLIAASYFSLLLSISLLFPSFPNQHTARAGLIWAILLAITLTYMSLPNWCGACLIGHACNILIWTIWTVTNSHTKSSLNIRERLCVLIFAPLSTVALFSCLNLTFMAYNYKSSQNNIAVGLKAGDTTPIFSLQTRAGNMINSNSKAVINFITNDCSFCQEQLPIIDAVAAKLTNSGYRFIHITQSEFPQESTLGEWALDKEGKLRELFQVEGYPTLFILGSDGKIVRVFHGVSQQLQMQLLPLLRDTSNIEL